MDEEQQAKGARLVRLVFLAGYALNHALVCGVRIRPGLVCAVGNMACSGPGRHGVGQRAIQYDPREYRAPDHRDRLAGAGSDGPRRRDPTEDPTSTPTRVRRFLSRFMIVVVVSLSIEFLVAVFGLVHDDPAQLPAASAIGVAVAVLLAGWGLFIWFNKHAEEVEPEAMERTKREDPHIG